MGEVILRHPLQHPPCTGLEPSAVSVPSAPRLAVVVELMIGKSLVEVVAENSGLGLHLTWYRFDRGLTEQAERRRWREAKCWESTFSQTSDWIVLSDKTEE